MRRKVINVVGAGLAGSLVTRVLRSRGHNVRVFDSGDKYSASQASSNLFIDHWLKKFSSGEAENGVRILEELFSDVIDQPFSQGLGYAMKVKHIAQRHILVEPDVVDEAVPMQQTPQSGDWKVVSVKAGEFDGPIVLCRGHRETFLDLKVKVGHCYLFRGRLPEGKSRVAIISPYRHEKLYQFDEDTIYYADSVAVAHKTYHKRHEEYKQKTLDRARRHLGSDALPFKIMVGYRPLMKGHDFGALTRHGGNIWSINGGGKNGLVAYASLAEKLAIQLEQ